MRWLFDRGLAQGADTLEETLNAAERIMSNRTAREVRLRKERAAKLFGSLVFPLEAVVDVILETAEAGDASRRQEGGDP